MLKAIDIYFKIWSICHYLALDFLAKVMQGEDVNSEYWKAKFIYGLPNLVVEKLRIHLRGANQIIDYNSYTYGQLISSIVSEGLNLCNDLKLQNQIKKQNLNR